MRILLLVDRYLPFPTSQAKMIHDLASAFVSLGHYAAVASPSDTLSTPLDVRDEDGIQVVRVRGPRIKGASYAMRTFHEERLSSTMWRAAREYFLSHRFDLIVYYSPTIFFGRLVARLKHMWRCPAYLVLRDIFPQWAVDMGLLRRGPVWAFFKYRELQQYAVADVIGVEMPLKLEYFDRQPFGRHYRLEVLGNWTVLDEGSLPKVDLRGRLGLRDEVVFLYGGTVGVAQNVDCIVRLARAFPRELRTAFVIVGGGSELERIKAEALRSGVESLHFLPPVPQPEFLAMLKEADVGVLSLDGRLHNFPGKSLSYMSAGLPILGSMRAGNWLGGVLVKEGAGFTAVPGDDDDLLRKAKALSSDGELRRAMGARSRALLEARFSAEAAARQVMASAMAAARRAVPGV
jgi:glycosyltransferase involved in cell wall biosynthesis